jgi:hypothetical protein
MTRLLRSSLCVAALCAVGSLHVAEAADRKARLAIDVHVSGDETWRGNGSDQATAKFSQHLSLVTFVRADGDPMDSNPKDPNYAEQQMRKAAKVSQAAHGASKQRPPVKTQEEMQTYVEAQARACNGNTSCLMKLSDEAAQWGAQLNGEVSAQDSEGSEDAPGRFLQYVGFSKCGSTIRVQVDDLTAGSYGDVNGPVPFQVKTRADYTGTNEERELLCTETNVVVDLNKKMLFSDGLLVFDVKGEVTRTDRGKTQTTKTDVPLKAEAFGWVSSQLREAPLSGKRQGTITLKKPNGSNVPFSATPQGTAKIELTWRFEEI